MFNVQQITDRLAKMSDPQLQQYAQMHKDDPYILPLAASEFKRRQQTRAGMQGQQGQPQQTVADEELQAMAPQPQAQPQQAQPQQAQPQQAQPQAPVEDQGIGRLAAPNIQGMKDGGIAGYAEGGKGQEKFGSTPQDRAKYRQYAMQKAAELGLDPKLVDAIFLSESRGGYDPVAKSGKGPVGIGQLTADTARAYGLNPKERTHPYKNIDASLRYMKDLQGKYGDPAKIAIAYNQGETVLNKHLAANNGKLVPENLHKFTRPGTNPQEPQNYLKKVLGVMAGVTAPTAVAATPQEPPKAAAPAAGTTPDLRNKDVPGSPDAIEYERRLQAERKPEKSWLEQRGRELLGAPEAIATAATGAVAPLTGTLYAAYKNLTGTPMTAEHGADATTFAPRSDYGKESVEAMQRAFEDFKIPPFIPGGSAPRYSPIKPGFKTKATTAAEAAEAAREAAETAKAPRLSGPASPRAKTENMSPTEAAMVEEAMNRRKLKEAAQDAAKAETIAQKAETTAGAAADRAKFADVLDTALREREAGFARGNTLAGVLSAGGIGALRQPAPYSQVDMPSEAPEMTSVPEGWFGEKEAPAAAPAVKPEATAPVDEKKAKKFGLTDEDMLMFGLNMMMSPSGRDGSELSKFLGDIGRSGIATLEARKAREKGEEDQAYKQALTEYNKALSKNIGRPQDEIGRYAESAKLPYHEAFEDIGLLKDRRSYIAAWTAMQKDPITYGDELAKYNNDLNTYLTAMGVGSLQISQPAQAVLSKYLPKK